MIALAWRWLAAHGAPIIAALLAGYLYGRAAEREDGLRADVKAAQAAAAEAAEAIQADGARAVQDIRDEAARAAAERVKVEGFRNALAENRAPRGDCSPDALALERVRVKVAAANGSALGELPSGERDAGGALGRVAE